MATQQEEILHAYFLKDVYKHQKWDQKESLGLKEGLKWITDITTANIIKLQNVWHH